MPSSAAVLLSLISAVWFLPHAGAVSAGSDKRATKILRRIRIEPPPLESHNSCSGLALLSRGRHDEYLRNVLGANLSKHQNDCHGENTQWYFQHDFALSNCSRTSSAFAAVGAARDQRDKNNRCATP